MQFDDKIKDLFASKLAGFKAQPPEGMWDKINDSLSTGAVEQIPVRKIALRRVISFASGIAAVLAIAVLLLTYAPDDNLLTNKPSIDNDKTTIPPAEIPDPVVSVPTTPRQPLYAKAYIQSDRQPEVIKSKAADNEPKYVPSDKSQETVLPDSRENENMPAGNHPDDEEVRKKIEEFERAGQNDALLTEAIYPEGKQNKGITLSMNGSSGFSRLTDKKVPVPTKFLRYALSPEANYAMSETSLAETQLMWPNSPRVKIEHRQPVSFGLKIDKRLNDCFSIETGLVYTYLSSKLSPATSVNSDYKLEGGMKFHYIGIPLSLNYTFARLGKAEFHLSAGGMIQKDFSGKISGNQEFKNWLADEILIEDYISDKISQDNPQFSIMANAGVSYPLYKVLNIYASVGGAFYFNAKNEFRTVYSDEKLQPDLNVGLRLKL